MRSFDDCTYEEYKEGVVEAFKFMKLDPECWEPNNVTNFLLAEELENSQYEPLIDATEFIWFLSIGEYEVRHNILEDRIADSLGYHIYRYENMGRYKADLTAEEIKEVEEDIAYIKSKITLPTMNSYEDRDWKSKLEDGVYPWQKKKCKNYK